MRRRLAAVFGATLLAAGLTAADTVAPAPVSADPPQVGDTATFPVMANEAQGSSTIEPITGPDGLFWGRSDDNTLVTVQHGEIFRERADLTGRSAGRWMTVAHGDVWITGNQTVHRITPAGAITTYPVPSLGTGDLATGADGNVWAVAQMGTRVVRITSTGDSSLSYTIPGGNGGQLTSGPDGALWVIADGQLVRIALDGTTVTYAPGVTTPVRIVSGADGNVWVAGRNGGVARVTTAGVATTIPTPATSTIGFEAAVGGGVHLLTATSVLTMAADGTTTARTLGSFPSPGGLWASPDGEVWVTQDSEDYLGHSAQSVLVLRSDGTTTRITSGVKSPYGAGIGPDGRVWVSSFFGGSLGRVDADGSVEAFAVPGARALLFGLAADEDGNLWFQQPNGTDSHLFRRAPDGALTSFPTPGLEPWDVAAGPDGAIWTIDQVAKAGRLATDGVFTVVPLPTLPAPVRIVAGDDGNLWVLSNGQGSTRIGRLTTSGVVTAFTVPGQSDLRDLAPGPDGNLWAVGPNVVVRMAPDGTSTTFSTGIPARTITTGPDGNLWIGGTSAGLGRVTPAGEVTTFPATGIESGYRLLATDDGYLWSPNPGPSTITRIAAAAATVEVTVDEEQVMAGDPVHAHVRVTNPGPTTLTGITLAGVAGCDGAVDDLAPGGSTTVDCTPTVTSLADLVATLATDQTQPEDSTPVDVEIRTGILGTVVDEGDGAPLPGTWVIALDASLTPTAATTADEDGRFDLPVPPGSYRLETWTPDGSHAFEWYASAQPPDDFDDLIPVDVAADAPATVDVELTALGPSTPPADPGSIEGTVVDQETGEPIVGALVAVVRGGIPVQGTATDGAGHYRFDDLERVPHVLVALDPPAHRHEFYEGHSSPGEALDLVTPSDTATADFHLAPTG